MTRIITGGIMRMNAVALVGAIGVGIMFSALHKGAMQNENYKRSWTTMLATIKEAFQPMIDVFATVMPYVYNFITSIASMIVQFNQAHPLLSKLIAGFLMLIPVLVLILSPMAIGIGLFNGLIVAFNSLWLLIAPLVTGLATISGPVLLISGAIVGLIAVGILLYKNWDTIKKKATELWQKLTETWNSIKGTMIKLGAWILNWTPFGKLVLIIIRNWDSIKKAFKIGKDMIVAIFNAIKNYISKQDWFKSLISKAEAFRKGFVSKMNDAKDGVKRAIEAIKGFFKRLVLKIPFPKVPKISVTEGHKKFLGSDIPYPKFNVKWNAKGGFFDRATLFGAGERGQEVLMPTENRKNMKPFSTAVAENLAELIQGFTGVSGSLEVPLIINGREFSRAVISDLDKVLRKRDTRQSGLLNRGNL
jgi:hypothetical protein